MRLSPDAFWAMTPRELAAAIGRPAAPMDRGRMRSLMQAFPDKETDHG
nr:phage tail assembly chaperone [Chthonobacter albigriseus]